MTPVDMVGNRIKVGDYVRIGLFEDGVVARVTMTFVVKRRTWVRSSAVYDDTTHLTKADDLTVVKLEDTI